MLPDRKVEYKKSRGVERDLEIPPDLTSSSIRDELVIPGTRPEGGTTLSTLETSERGRTGPGGGGEVLPTVENIEVKRDGEQRWLLIQGEPEDVWFRVVEFWQENGILLEEQDPTVGIMVTDWIENRADIKNDFITDAFRGLFDGLYSASTRDQFRIRIEPSFPQSQSQPSRSRNEIPPTAQSAHKPSLLRGRSLPRLEDRADAANAAAARQPSLRAQVAPRWRADLDGGRNDVLVFKFSEAARQKIALMAAGDRARGATAYVSLEPCCHHGRTPPCTEALIEAGVATHPPEAQVVATTEGNVALAEVRQQMFQPIYPHYA